MILDFSSYPVHCSFNWSPNLLTVSFQQQKTVSIAALFTMLQLSLHTIYLSTSYVTALQKHWKACQFHGIPAFQIVTEHGVAVLSTESIMPLPPVYLCTMSFVRTRTVNWVCNRELCFPCSKQTHQRSHWYTHPHNHSPLPIVRSGMETPHNTWMGPTLSRKQSYKRDNETNNTSSTADTNSKGMQVYR